MAGWGPEAEDIYMAALLTIRYNDAPLRFGPAHIVWEDENFEDVYIQWCLDNFDEYTEGFSDHDMKVVRWSLEELLKVPESKRFVDDDPNEDEMPIGVWDYQQGV